MSFLEPFSRFDWDQVSASIRRKSGRDVDLALAKPDGRLDPEDFKALISPAAASRLEQMAQRSHRMTVERFGRIQQLYAPLYLSNVCSNVCTYCGFSASESHTPKNSYRIRDGHGVPGAEGNGDRPRIAGNR